jgi:hypothetical protein
MLSTWKNIKSISFPKNYVERLLKRKKISIFQQRWYKAKINWIKRLLHSQIIFTIPYQPSNIIQNLAHFKVRLRSNRQLFTIPTL